MKSPTPTPQSWKHPGNLAKSWKYPENLAEAWKLWQKICTYSIDHCRTDFWRLFSILHIYCILLCDPFLDIFFNLQVTTHRFYNKHLSYLNKTNWPLLKHTQYISNCKKGNLNYYSDVRKPAEVHVGRTIDYCRFNILSLKNVWISSI